MNLNKSQFNLIKLKFDMKKYFDVLVIPILYNTCIFKEVTCLQIALEMVLIKIT